MQLCRASPCAGQTPSCLPSPSCSSSPIANFTRDPDAILKDFDFGRAHHRVLHFVNRHSGLRVADLLDALRNHQAELGPRAETAHRQRLYRAAGGKLLSTGARLLYPTEAGRALAIRLAAPQLVRLAEALRAAGPTADAVVQGFLQAMINAEERPKVSSIMASLPAAADDSGNAEVS